MREIRRAVPIAESGLVEGLEDSIQERIIDAPWIAVEYVRDEDAGKTWRIVGSSEGELSGDSLAAMRAIAVVDWGRISSTYKSSAGRTSTGTSEYADTVCYDAATGAECGSERVKEAALSRCVVKPQRDPSPNGRPALPFQAFEFEGN